MKNILTIMKKELRRFFGDRRMLATLILPGLFKAGDIAGKCLAQIVDNAHPDHFIHICFRKLFFHEESHQRHHPAMLGNAFMAAAGGITMSGSILQAFCNG